MLHSFVVSDTNSLLSTQNFDMHAYAQTGTSSFDASFSSVRSVVNSDRNVSIIVTASQEAPRVIVDNPRLTSEARNLLKRGLEEFRRECGTRYPLIEHRGVALKAVVTIVDASSSLREAARGAVKLEYGAGNVSTGLAAAFASEIGTSKADSRYEVNVTAEGGPGLQALAPLVTTTIKDKPTLDEIGKALAAYLADTTLPTAVPVRYDVADMPEFSVASRDPWTLEKERYLLQIVDEYHKLADRQTMVEAILSGADPRYADLSSPTMAPFHDKLKVVQAAVSASISLHSACMADIPPAPLTHCMASPPEIASALGLDLPRPLHAPLGRFAVALGGGSKWRLLSRKDAEDVFSARLAGGALKPIFGLAGDYANNFRNRVVQSVPTLNGESTTLLGYLLDSQYLTSVEIYAERAGANGARTSLIAWNKGSIQSDPSFLPPKGDATDTSNASYDHWIVLAQRSVSPFKMEKTASYSQRVELNEKLPSVVEQWIRETGEAGGAGSIKLDARDSFGDSHGKTTSTFVLEDVKWDIDKDVGIAKVTYSMNTGEPGEVFYLGRVNSASAQFPTVFVVRRDHLTVQNATRHPLKTPVDKWGALTFIPCEAGGKVDSSYAGNIRLKIDRVSDGFDYTISTLADRGVIDFTLAQTASFRVGLREDPPYFVLTCSKAPVPT